MGKKIVTAKKSVKKVVSSEAVQPSSSSSTTTTASAPAVTPAPAAVTEMTDSAVQECNALPTRWCPSWAAIRRSAQTRFVARRR